MKIQKPPVIYYNRKCGYQYTSKNDFENANHNLRQKRIISISPGGWQGFYMLGITNFICNHYDLSNFVFTGASAGAWNSLFLAHKYNHGDFCKNIMKKMIVSKSIADTELHLKKILLSNYKDNDFAFENIFLSVTSLQPYMIQTHLYYNFINLEDAINCCIASSHIPLVTSKQLINRYDDKITFDGGFSMNPYLEIQEASLHITPQIWNRSDFHEVPSQLRAHIYFKQGWEDTEKNKHFLDDIFRELF